MSSGHRPLGRGLDCADQPPEEIRFIDEILENPTVARNFGIKAIEYKNFDLLPLIQKPFQKLSKSKILSDAEMENQVKVCQTVKAFLPFLQRPLVFFQGLL